jgi:hypothetical protein
MAVANGPEWRVIFAYPQSYDRKTADTVPFVKAKLAVEFQHRVLILDYFELANKLACSADVTASGLGQHMTDRLVQAVKRAI